MTSSRWDFAAVRAGAGVALLFAVPFAVGARLAADNDNGGLAVALSLAATVGFLIGGGCAAWIQETGTPLSHGIVTAAGTYVAAQAVFIAIRLARGDGVRWFGTFFTLTFVVFAGLLGGLLGQRLRNRGLRPPGADHRKAA